MYTHINYYRYMHTHINFKKNLPKQYQQKPATKSSLWRKGFIWLMLAVYSPSLKEVRTGAKAGTGAETMLSAGLACLASFLVHLRTTCPGDGVTHSGLEPPISTKNRDNPSETCPRSV